MRFGRRVDIDGAFRRAGLEWPVWWAVGQGDMTTLVEKISLLTFVGFAPPELALPWFVRLHAAAAGCDPLAPVIVVRRVASPMRSDVDEPDDLDDLLDDVRDSEHSDAMKRDAYESWLERAADWRERGSPT